jgi:hypothetical protein
LQKLAENAISLAASRRKPIFGYGTSAVIRLNNMYYQDKRQWEMRQTGHRYDENRASQLMRQFSTGGNTNSIFPQQQMMYGQTRPPFNQCMTQQQQMMMTSGPHMVGPSMQMGRLGQMPSFTNGPSPSYTANTRMPFNQQKMGGQGVNSQQMLGYFNNPSPASSLGSNPSQHDPTQRPAVGSVNAPLPFGSPGIQMRTPSMPSSVAPVVNNPDGSSSIVNQGVFSVENPHSALVASRSQFDQTKIDEVLSLFQNCRSRVIAVLMKDTILDLFYDSVFDASPICSCNANIRSAELGLYIQIPGVLSETTRIQQRQQQDPNFKTDYWSGLMSSNSTNPCSCGFSAVRHRLLCGDGRGLFADDVQEAGASQFKAVVRGKEGSSKKRTLNELMDCLRFLSLNRNLATSFKQVRKNLIF